MSSYALTDVKLYIGGKDLSGDTNAGTLSYEAEALDATTFGSGGTREWVGGLKSYSLEMSGLFSAGTNEVDPVLFSAIGSSGAMTVCPTTGADGEPGFIFEEVLFNYAPGASVGELYAFSTTAMGTSGRPLVKGTVLHPTTTARTSSSTGTGQIIGAVSATQKLYAALHVTEVSGTDPTLDVVVESDDNAGFTSATSRITFDEATAVGGQYATPVSGAITDTRYRVNYTIGGTDTPTFKFIVVVGIV